MRVRMKKYCSCFRWERLAPCLLSSDSLLPAYNSCQLWNRWAAIQERPGGPERACGQGCSSQTTAASELGKRRWRGGKKGRKPPFFLSLHPHLPLNPILRVRISFCSISVEEGTTRTCCHLSRSVPWRVSSVTPSFQARASSPALTGEQPIHCNKLA